MAAQASAFSSSPDACLTRFGQFVQQELRCEAVAVAVAQRNGERTYSLASGYSPVVLRHFATDFVRADPGYACTRAHPEQIFTWDSIPSYRDGQTVRDVLAPAGFDQGSSIPLISANGILLGELHLNLAGHDFGPRVLDAISESLSPLTHVLESMGQVSQARLSPRQIEVLRLIAAGYSNRDIGQRLCISQRTVDAHVVNLTEALGVRTRIQATVKALRLGLIDLHVDIEPF